MQTTGSDDDVYIRVWWYIRSPALPC